MANRLLLKASILTSCLLIPLLSQAQTASEEAGFHQEFRLSSSGVPISITAERRLSQLENGLWQMEVEAGALIGKVREVTEFRWNQCTPQTTRYTYLRQGLGQKRKALLVLDRESGTALAVRANGQRREFPIADSTTDKLSQTLALQCMLSRGDPELVVDVADEKGREQLRYRRDGEELLQTPAGPLQTVRLVRERNDSSRQTWLWFAPEHNFALVKLVQEEDNQRHEMLIRSL